MSRNVGRMAVAGFVTALCGLGGAVLAGAALQEEPFPHDEHEGLFPLCTGCHSGVEVAESGTYYPAPEICVRCHSGGDLEVVVWEPPLPAPGNLRFDHSTHAAELLEEGDAAQSCESCHASEPNIRMSVTDEILLGGCFGCHAHEATEHIADADCSACHVPLAESGFGIDEIRALPTPLDHETGRFLTDEHGLATVEEVSRCATCHTADRCISCHVEPDRPQIAAMPAAPPGMDLPPAVAHYNEPSTHTDGGWFREHRSVAGPAECATCHTQDDCRACHVDPVPLAIRSLPTRAGSIAPGVGLEARAPGSHESLFFMAAHQALAGADVSSCNTCHQETFCVQCHDGPSGGYHPANFVSRHSADAFGRSTECSTCHSTEVFCRACHEGIGITGFDRAGPAYHIGDSLWLIRHGQAARQNLESCTSCHAQNDCTACHSTVGAFGVSPHSRDFDAKSAWARSPRTCLACHVGNPLIGGLP